MHTDLPEHDVWMILCYYAPAHWAGHNGLVTSKLSQAGRRWKTVKNAYHKFWTTAKILQ